MVNTQQSFATTKVVSHSKAEAGSVVPLMYVSVVETMKRHRNYSKELQKPTPYSHKEL